MAVLTLPGADRVLAAVAATLPQPDQLCGPFAACAALHAVLEPHDVPSLVELAAASSSAIWPHDMATWRPAGTSCDRSGWSELPAAPSPEASGTDAAGLARGIVDATHGTVAVVPASGTEIDADLLAALLVGLVGNGRPIGVVANVRTGALDPGTGWDVGHFVVLWAIDATGPDGARVAVADTYRELGAEGEPPGCRWVPVERLTDALSAPPGRGLLLMVTPDRAAATSTLIGASGLHPTTWST